MNTCFCPRDCPDRHMGCHATCEGYKAWSEKNSEEREARSKARAAQREALDYEIAGVRKRARAAGRKM